MGCGASTRGGSEQLVPSLDTAPSPEVPTQPETKSLETSLGSAPMDAGQKQMPCLEQITVEVRLASAEILAS